MKNKFFSVIILLILTLCFTACSTTQESVLSNVSSTSSQIDVDKASDYSSSESSLSTSSSQESPKSASSKASSVFKNKFGTATTMCNHSGCTNYIASTGDTNCCTTHSKKCLGCSKYIDEDATWCISCIETTLNSKTEEKGNALNKDCDICAKQATKTINGEYYCDKHYTKATEWYSKQAKK